MSQSKVLRIMGFDLLAHIVNRHLPISKQKMFLRRQIRVQGSGKEHPAIQKNQGGIPWSISIPIPYPVPWTLPPDPYSPMMAMASISINASGLTSALTATPVAAGNPFLKYFRRTAAVSLYRSRVVT